MHEEIMSSIENENEIKKENCPFTRSVLLESQRWNPVVDSLPHRASADVVVDGVLIEKDSTLQGTYFSVTKLIISSFFDCCDARPKALRRARSLHPRSILQKRAVRKRHQSGNILNRTSKLHRQANCNRRVLCLRYKYHSRFSAF